MPIREESNRKTIVFTPHDAHGHVNSMLALAGELRALGCRTIFITNDATTPKSFGHELFLLGGDQTSALPNNEQDAYLKAKLFTSNTGDKSFSYNVELAGDSVDDETFRTFEHNASFWTLVYERMCNSDDKLEELLISLKPDLVVCDCGPPRPAVARLSQDSYAKKVANLRGGLRCLTLMSVAPLEIYYYTELKQVQRGSRQVPMPWFGFPIRRQMSSDEHSKHMDCIKQAQTASGQIKALLKIAELSHFDDINSASMTDAQYARLNLNESKWLNIYMFPKELDYNNEFRIKLDKSKWIRVDALVRPILSTSQPLDDKSQHLLDKLELWKQSGLRESHRTIYLSMGTLVSTDLGVMELVLQQVFTCLKEQVGWRFAVSLGVRHVELEKTFKDEFDHWQNKEARLITSGWWPQPEVFKRHLADAYVVHGGNNTICELFHYSEGQLPPLVVVPGIVDQLDIARRIEELGLGVALPVGRLMREDATGKKDLLLLNALRHALKMGHLVDGQHNLSTFRSGRSDASECARLIKIKLDED